MSTLRTLCTPTIFDLFWLNPAAQVIVGDSGEIAKTVVFGALVAVAKIYTAEQEPQSFQNLTYCWRWAEKKPVSTAQAITWLLLLAMSAVITVVTKALLALITMVGKAWLGHG